MVCEEIRENCEEAKTSVASTIISFVAGGVIGSLVTFYVTRKKMRDEKEREIADVTSYYDELREVCTNTEMPAEDICDDHPRDDLPPEDKPYVITQKEYVEEMDFSKETVVYYEKDDILTDMFDREVVIEDTIGRDALNHFNEDEEGAAYARNDKLGVDYEIILEHKSFASVVGENMED